ncbi:GNAT family acetyltransferase [Streptococcus agalactiae]|nr:GNAT family acetyltransferase [Streptococcus agalactiae]AUO92645.1 GNAT family acetyltransferase [Streptococcus agalactiae]AUP02527.1 GNAT family acetyltransferase [Streptococcus agalactiae]AUP08839.1 GNAT family acetyltransferase [Streptococcus agalactiae]AUP12040.1 GNAT family acetyltransferase [Streptococcus agalactiae]
MEIKEYENNPYHLAQQVDLINYCQNIEAKLDIKMAEQDDIFQIENYYQNRKGQFWIALENEKVVGSIALLRIDDKTAVLKNFLHIQNIEEILFDLFENYLKDLCFLLELVNSQELSWILQKKRKDLTSFMKIKDLSK